MSTNAAKNTSDAVDEATSEGHLLKQTLMDVDECFLYKLPPLATSGGHRGA